MKGTISGIILILYFFVVYSPVFAAEDMDRVSTTGESQEQSVKTAKNGK